MGRSGRRHHGHVRYYDVYSTISHQTRCIFQHPMLCCVSCFCNHHQSDCARDHCWCHFPYIHLLGLLRVVSHTLRYCKPCHWLQGRARQLFSNSSLLCIRTNLRRFYGSLCRCVWGCLRGPENCSIETKDDGSQERDCSNGMNGGIYALFLLSYFFYQEVIKNTIHVIIGGTVGTWWFLPEEGKGCCSSGVLGSMKRALTTSFGSICFGSLLVAIIQTLKQLARNAREQGGSMALLACIAECILGCLESLLQYFNKWAFIYVGLYGF